MKNKLFLFGSLTISMLLLITGCTKDDNQISGNITYIAHSDGVEYIANGATVYLMLAGSDTQYAQKTTADANGDYSFYPVDDGNFYIEADNTYLLDNYTAKTVEFTVKGSQNVTKDLQLQ